jgi:PAS domain S-box-containing protein
MNLRRIETFFFRITRFGVKDEFSIPEKRKLILSNALAILFSFASLILLVIPENQNMGGVIEAIFMILTFSIPLLLNAQGYLVLSRLYLCWIPVISILILMVGAMRDAPQVEVHTYDGLRIYLLALSCVPYLLFDRRDRSLLLAGVLPSFAGILFFDGILDLFSVGYLQKGVAVSNYHFMQVRTVVAYLIINGSCFSLKVIIGSNDRFNQRLLSELNLKNELIKAQSENELKQMNDQLMANLEALERRELMLRKTQQIAGLGTWEQDVHSGIVQWSDEMYNIFGLDKSYNLLGADLMDDVFGDASVLIKDAHQRLLQTHKPYDFTFETKTPIGYSKWIRVHAFPMTSEGEIISVNGIVLDVTRYKESEELIRANEKKYRSLFEQASDGIMITNLKGDFIDVNESMCKMLGYTKDELLQSNISKLVDQKQLTRHPIEYEQVLQGKQVFSERIMVQKTGGILFVEANIKLIGSNQVMAIARDISERKQIENEKEYARYLLRKRIKELTTLNKSSQVLARETATIEDALQEIVNILPDGWQYTNICAARIHFNDLEFRTKNFVETSFSQTAEFIVDDARRGVVEVVYLESRPEDIEGPFLFEERNLINAIAEMLRIYLIRKSQEAELNQFQANLRATINNTEILIWSVDRNFNLLTYNEPYARHMKERYNHEVKIGAYLFPEAVSEDWVANIAKWTNLLMRALTGEIVKFEDTRFDKSYVYSLSPIIENGKVFGVSVFADDVTEQRESEKALADAQIKIGQFRLAALRSVMNPHFIFNALNSIQFFITKNDRLNAINYLSTFSKLIRGIISNAVHNTIKLSEEIELLKHYVNLEMLRFENKFTFNLIVDQDLDIDTIEIPSLLIQPYVENAILHGLYNKLEPGRLVITVKAHENGVVVVIEDNGIGRRAAAELRAKNFPNHKSIAMALTEERLRLINTNNPVSFAVEDLIENGHACGTRIMIFISLDNDGRTK